MCDEEDACRPAVASGRGSTRGAVARGRPTRRSANWSTAGPAGERRRRRRHGRRRPRHRAGRGRALTRRQRPSPAAAPSAGPAVRVSRAANLCPAPTVKPPAKPATFKRHTPRVARARSGSSRWSRRWRQSGRREGHRRPPASAILFSPHVLGGDAVPPRVTTEGIYVLQCGDPTGSGSGSPGYARPRRRRRTASTRRHPGPWPGPARRTGSSSVYERSRPRRTAAATPSLRKSDHGRMHRKSRGR